MNFSDETVEKFYAYWGKRLKYLAGFDYVPTESEQDFAEDAYKAALSSLTLADLMQVEEVQLLVELACQLRTETQMRLDFRAMQEKITPCIKTEGGERRDEADRETIKRCDNATTPPTELKQ